MVMLNDLDRFHLVMDVIDRVPGLGVARRGAAPADGRRAPALPRVHARSRARTRPRSATGPGRMPWPAECDPGRQRRFEQPQAVAARRAPTAVAVRPLARGGTRRRGALRDALDRGGSDRRGRPPHRPRRHASFVEPVVVDDAVERRLDALIDLAPLHQPRRLRALDAVGRLAARRAAGRAASTPRSTRRCPPAAATYALPRRVARRGGPLRRFGFHGLSHAYASRAPPSCCGRPLEELRIVTCHLGAGASLAAVARGARSTRRWGSRRSRGW